MNYQRIYVVVRIIYLVIAGCWFAFWFVFGSLWQDIRARTFYFAYASVPPLFGYALLFWVIPWIYRRCHSAKQI